MDLTPFERYRDIIDDWDAFAEALARPLPYCVWANRLRAPAARVEEWLVRCDLDIAPLEWCAGAWRVHMHEETPPLGTLLPYLTGLYHTQEEVSLLPSWLLAPAAGERVLDTCAAPGGKTAHLAMQMHNRGTVIANDRSSKRMRALRATIDRLGLLNVSMMHYDAANFPRDIGTFDRILVDVPCSCEGTTRKNPHVFEQLARIDHASMGGLQAAILRRALEQLRPGGRLVYSTCTYAPEENECVVQQALEETGWEAYELEECEVPGFQAADGLLSWHGQSFDATMTRAMRVWPHHEDTGGFFVASIRRRADP